MQPKTKPTISPTDYQSLVKEVSPDSPLVANMAKAFAIGGVISVVGQVIYNFFDATALSTQHVQSFTSVTLIFLGVALTGLNLYPKLGRFAGAGSAIPITGFANSVAAAAMEFKREGPVLGLGSRIWSVAGPVLTYGVLTSFVVGLVYYVITII